MQLFTRERCQQMVREICGKTCGKNAAPRQRRAAKIMAPIGKGFAEAMMEMIKQGK